MPYVDPATVVSPKDRWGADFEVLLNTGPGGWSVASGKWDGEKCLAMRWNSAEGESSFGSPQSRGHPTWFIVPLELNEAVRSSIDAHKSNGGMVFCSIHKPSDYQIGAWRIEAKLGATLVEKLRGKDLVFPLPQLEKRLCIPEKAYLRAGPEGLLGKFVGEKWVGDLYSNGISEAENPNTIEVYKAAFVENVVLAAKNWDLLD